MVPIRRGEGYWKERRRREGEERVAEILREYAGYYRRAFLLNPLVDLKVLAKFENERSGFLTTKDGRLVLVLQPWWSEELVRAANEFRETRYQAAYERLNRLAADRRFPGQDTELPDELLWFQGLAAGHVGQFDHAIRNLGILTGRAYAAQEDTTGTEGWLPFVTNDYRYIMATLMYLGNRHDQAIPTFQRALEFDLGLYVAHVQLARICEEQGRLEDALKERRLALDVNPDDPDLLVDLAMTLVKMNRLTESQEPLAQAATRNPRDARVPYLQGKVAHALQRPAEARAGFQRFVAIAPTRFANLKSEALRVLAELP
jgi:tetratricopeptide (TPR) repeat protein